MHEKGQHVIPDDSCAAWRRNLSSAVQIQKEEENVFLIKYLKKCVSSTGEKSPVFISWETLSYEIKNAPKGSYCGDAQNSHFL